MSDATHAATAAGAPMPALPPSPALARRLSASPLLVALDIDGTLAPIAPTPGGAAVPAATLETLERLTKCQGVQVALVTGRSAADALRMVGVSGCWIIGNHGIELIAPDGSLRVNEDAQSFAPAIAEAARLLERRLAAFEGTIVEDKHWTLSVHFRLAAPEDRPAIERVLEDVGKEIGLRITHGKQVYELRPPVEITKGTALLDLAAIVGARDAAGALFYAGDDRTDEDAFRALRGHASGAVTVHVGGAIVGHATEAEFIIPDPPALRELLEWLIVQRAGRARIRAPNE